MGHTLSLQEITVALMNQFSIITKFPPACEKRHAPMYCCYFMRAGRIAQGCRLKVQSLDAAIATGQKILVDQDDIDDWDGLEIWLDQALLYKSPLQRNRWKTAGKA